MVCGGSSGVLGHPEGTAWVKSLVSLGDILAWLSSCFLMDHHRESVLLHPFLFGKVLCAPPGHPLRDACFVPGTLWPVSEWFVRCVSHPRKEWTKQVVSDCGRFFGWLDAANQLAQDKANWTRLVHHKVCPVAEARAKHGFETTSC